MKKLMLTSALAGLLVSGSAIAQTTISGELRLNLKATEAKVATGTTTASKRGFGNEQQINFATKGKLNVGDSIIPLDELPIKQFEYLIIDK